MDKENKLELLQRYEQDRRALLCFILSSNLIKNVVMPPGAISLDDVNLDQLSVNYVLNCAKEGGILKLSNALEDYGDNVEFPPTVESQDHTIAKELTLCNKVSEEVNTRTITGQAPDDVSDLVPILPPLRTGISDGDLQETAYEILLACAGGAFGDLVVPSKTKKKDKRSKFLGKFGRSKKEAPYSRSRKKPGLADLLETLRVQMEISEAMDRRSREGLLNALVGKAGTRMDALLVPLELLCSVPRTEFPDKKAYIRWQKRQLNMLEEGLLNHPAAGDGEFGGKASEMRMIIAKILESESLPDSTGVQMTELFRSLRDVAIPLSERPGYGESAIQVCHWADGYHLNVRLYEKMLMSVFDVLEEGKVIKEAGDVLELLKTTWHVLGVTETIHYTCFSWVLFNQFFITGDKGLLKYAIEQLKKIRFKEQRDPQERLQLESLQCNVESKAGSLTVSFLESFLTPIQKWADRQLEDYYLNFAKDFEVMEDVVAALMVTRQLLMEETAFQSSSMPDQDQIELYISTSTENAFSRILEDVDQMSKTAHGHPLCLLADKTKELLKANITLFIPNLSRWHPQATFVSISLLHKLYGMKLKPFIADAEQLTDDVVSVLSSAHSLEQYVCKLLVASYGENDAEAYIEKLARYEIETSSAPLVMSWINSHLATLVAWVERAIQLEKWEPISTQQRHGSSIVEVYRIVEETIDQFFALGVPLHFGEVNSFIYGIDNAFYVYANYITANLARKEEMVPPIPPLKRYKKEGGFKAFLKKEPREQKILEEGKSRDISVLATPTLSIQLNTLQYTIDHLNKLEVRISELWSKNKSREKFTKGYLDDESKISCQIITLEGSRKDLDAAIGRICGYTGTKIVFVDLREPFIDNLYQPSVSQSRLEAMLDPLDTALGHLCGIIVEPLRDRVVTSLLQACLDGLVRVLLDGGSSRIFNPSDAPMLEEDLDILTEFFNCEGDGLPTDTVENLSAHVRRIIKLHSYEALISDLRSMNIDGAQWQGNSSKLNADAKTLLKILCRRTDSEASQFLKKRSRILKSAS